MNGCRDDTGTVPWKAVPHDEQTMGPVLTGQIQKELDEPRLVCVGVGPDGKVELDQVVFGRDHQGTDDGGLGIGAALLIEDGGLSLGSPSPSNIGME